MGAHFLDPPPTWMDTDTSFLTKINISFPQNKKEREKKDDDFKPNLALSSRTYWPSSKKVLSVFLNISSSSVQYSFSLLSKWATSTMESNFCIYYTVLACVSFMQVTGQAFFSMNG